MGRKSKKKGYVCITDSHCGTAETNTALQLCSNLKKERKKKLALEERKGKKKDVRYISMMDTSNLRSRDDIKHLIRA